MKGLPPELVAEQIRVEKMARGYGLDFFQTVFEMITYDQMSEFAAQGGFPSRYPHWRFGMEYEKLSKSYEYGLSKIYEMVINTDPCYAYLMEGNMFVDQKLVMAHVYGHCDFFKNNQWFSRTDRKMMDTMANHGTRIRRYMDRYGYDVVEDFIDKCLSIENLIDRHSPYFSGSTSNQNSSRNQEPVKQEVTPLKNTGAGYMDKYINPPEYLEKQREEIKKTETTEKKVQTERDVLHYLIKNSPLEDWQQDILSIIRVESYYFAPQGMTKIMNEGWASYWHTTMMTNGLLTDGEVIDYADHHSGTTAMAPTGFNPYKIGIELFRNIEERWNKGQFGREWEQCEDYTQRKNWDKKLGLGRQKIFEVRRNYNDVMFIDEFLTEDFCIQNKMFVYKYNQRTNEYVIDTRNFAEVKKKLLFQLTNFGQPIIEVMDGNYENKGELLLRHLYEGVDLQPDYMKETMKNVQEIWKRPVNLMTIMDNQEKIFRSDGSEFKEITLKDLPKSSQG
ncbi:MAG: SpoVR family protein [Bdellovibrionota bacterium]